MLFLLFLLDDRRIRIREVQKHMDPMDLDPQHCCKHMQTIHMSSKSNVCLLYECTQCCGCGCLSRIPDPTFFHPGSRIRTVSIPDPESRILIKEFKYFNPKKAKKLFLSSKKYDPGCSSRIPDPDADFLPSRIPDPGVKKSPNPGSGSATLNVACTLILLTNDPSVFLLLWLCAAK
jgi:hypothetical protein